MFTNEEITKYRKTATRKSYGLFSNNRHITCDPENIAEIVEESLTLLIGRWKRLGRTSEDLLDSYICNLLNKAAEELHYLPENRGPLKPEKLTGMTRCKECGAEFDWIDARWSMKGGKRQNRALCSSCGAFLVTSEIIVPVELVSDHVSDFSDGSYPTLTTPCIEQIICSRNSKHYQVVDEFYKIDDNVITDQRIQTLMKPGMAPSWFSEYAEMIKHTDMTQGEIAVALNMTDAKLSKELLHFKGELQAYFGGKPVRRKAQNNPARKPTGQIELFDDDDDDF